MIKHLLYGVLGTLVMSFASPQTSSAQSAAAKITPPNYDESKVRQYQLPDPLVTEDGKPVRDAEAWKAVRRPELLKLFEEHVYGVAPAATPIQFRVVHEKPDALNGKATRQEIEITIAEGETPLTMTMLLYLPKSDQPVPVFIGLNFWGNHALEADPQITLNPNWFRNSAPHGIENNRATEASRGSSTSRWPLDLVIDRGYGVATIYYGDIDPDEDDGFKNGIHGYFPRADENQPRTNEWGSIAAWAWGLSRAMDYLEQNPAVNASQVAVLGHSRLGKTSLWAGATDERFALVISNNSGCGGASLSRRNFGELIDAINIRFPHWFCQNFHQYNNNEEALPVDQHQLIALIAPRPIYIASAEDDRWADPKGEFLSAREADRVYRFLGTEGFGGTAPPEESPAVNQPLKTGTIGYHIRTGKHDINEYDWQQYLDFADIHFGRLSNSSRQ